MRSLAPDCGSSVHAVGGRIDSLAAMLGYSSVLFLLFRQVPLSARAEGAIVMGVFRDEEGDPMAHLLSRRYSKRKRRRSEHKHSRRQRERHADHPQPPEGALRTPASQETASGQDHDRTTSVAPPFEGLLMSPQRGPLQEPQGATGSVQDRNTPRVELCSKCVVSGCGSDVTVLVRELLPAVAVVQALR